MEDIYVVSVGARARLLAAIEQCEDRYIVRAGLEPDLLGTAAAQPPRPSIEHPAFRVRATAAVPSVLGRE